MAETTSVPCGLILATPSPRMGSQRRARHAGADFRLSYIDKLRTPKRMLLYQKLRAGPCPQKFTSSFLLVRLTKTITMNIGCAVRGVFRKSLRLLLFACTQTAAAIAIILRSFSLAQMAPCVHVYHFKTKCFQTGVGRACAKASHACCRRIVSLSGLRTLVVGCTSSMLRP